MQEIKNFFESTTYREWNFFFAAVGICTILFLLVSLYAFVKRKGKELERKRKDAIERDATFTLPDRENEFIKERLKHHLKPQKEGLKEYKFSECVPSFEYTRSILSKLKAAPLSVSDRLQTQNISHDVTHFAFQERLSPEDVRVLNDRLSDMIKLSAKYAVIK